jgi:chromosome segregation ATPase
LNGKIFAGLSKLKKVDLRGNECVNKMFVEHATIAQSIPEACSFHEQIETIDEISTQINEKSEKILREQKEFKGKLETVQQNCEAKFKSEIETLRNEKIQLQTQAQNDKLRLESEIAELRKEAQQWKDQVGIIQETFNRLDRERNQTATLEIDQQRKLVESKTGEIKALKDQNNQCNSQVDVIKESYEALNVERIETAAKEIEMCKTEIETWKTQAKSWQDANNMCHSKSDLIKETFEVMTGNQKAFYQLEIEINEKHREQINSKLAELESCKEKLNTKW